MTLYTSPTLSRRSEASLGSKGSRPISSNEYLCMYAYFETAKLGGLLDLALWLFASLNRRELSVPLLPVHRWVAPSPTTRKTHACSFINVPPPKRACSYRKRSRKKRNPRELVAKCPIASERLELQNAHGQPMRRRAQHAIAAPCRFEDHLRPGTWRGSWGSLL
ncbi:hypothetical protein M441DRAFT_92142 [Trichoderma asperellum CBS 433.97]|uniref:Uncharacterized protein n=1 Tax=Trichoderma asperellum (strain ATCC 204424 / CBS 433.97 / NBRC 101777) TaxID=1042311 RepID=A0A2T3YYN9_TRIA4|nr:hypothetical protein M441DRAFT_92142 [Trichoderma asperellum CBS 433.97]PTB37657.1 hypothetical protein M441DRAFT_92142 [Trichoderma asperellum CBS 433.97]